MLALNQHPLMAARRLVPGSPWGSKAHKASEGVLVLLQGWVAIQK